LIFLKRWSFLALALTILVATAGPLLFRNDPDSPVAPPFSKPLWLDRDSPPTLRLFLEDGKTSTSLDWQGTAPRQFSLKGHVKFGTSPSRAGIYWQTPEETILLEDLSGYYDILVDLDARDITFKLDLGISPFESAMKKLVPSDGQYRIFIESDVPVTMSDLLLTLEGGRWGFLGTDQRGRDVFHLFIMGIRVSLLVGISATVIATLIGLSMGLISGYAGGLIDSFIMRGVDVLLSIPILPILMALAGIWGKGLWQLVLILSLFSWMGTARTVRALTLTLRDACFIENLRALGSTTSYILFRHLLPETLPLLLANIALGVPGAILAEAGISFLGLSDPRVISWGRMLHEAHSFGAFSTGAWWLLLPPGLGIAFLCLIFLDIGKYLEEKVDPRLKGEKAN
jgi:peptide/nickel transport system permease protein